MKLRRLLRKSTHFMSLRWANEINLILARKSKVSSFGQLCLSALAYISLNDTTLDYSVVHLLGVLFLVNVIRLGLSFTSQTNVAWHQKFWQYAFSGTTVVTAVLWSFVSIACVNEFGIDDVHTLHILIIMAGVAAAGSTGLSPHRPLAWGFAGLTLIPMIVKLGSVGEHDHLLTMGILVCYLIFLIFQINVHSGTILELFSRRAQDRALLDASFEAIVMHEDGKILAINRSFEKLFGYTQEEALGKSIFALVAKEDWGGIVPAMAIERTEPYYCRGQKKNGELFQMEARGRFFFYEGRNVRLVCAQDITERVAAEQLSELREKAALDSSRLKSQFLANMSHEIRTPMNSIITISDLLQSEQLSEEGSRFVRTLRESGASLLGLINDILDYSKIEAGHLELENIEFDLAELIESQIDLLQSKAAEKGIGLSCSLDPELPAMVMGDRVRLGQILLNLIGNAIKFTHEGKVSVRAYRECMLSERSFRVRFEIEDSGCGISQENGRKLFQPFVQADASTARRHGGTGLGLSICKNLVALMKGEIGFLSDGHSGTTFWFEMPLSKDISRTLREHYFRPEWTTLRAVIVRESFVNQSSIAAYLRSWGMQVSYCEPKDLAIALEQAHLAFANASASEHVTAPDKIIEIGGRRLPAMPRIADLHEVVTQMLSGGTGSVVSRLPEPKPVKHDPKFVGARVLVAEDNSTNQMVIIALLKHYGIAAEVAGHGRLAIQASRVKEYDLILMDCQMPELDGMEATRFIRAEEASGVRKRRVPIVALTANASKEDRDACLAAGMDNFLSKPIHRAELVKVLSQFLKLQDVAPERASS